MVRNKKFVTINVDPKFFVKFERERVREQDKLRKKFGSFFNLSQTKFTSLMEKKDFEFNFPGDKQRRRKR